MRKKYLFAFIALALTAGSYFLYTPDSDPQAMRAKYANSQSRFLNLEPGLSLHYRDEGNRAGPVLVLLHGNSASLHSFDPLIDRLGDDFRLLRYDHPGHGLTGPNATQSYTYADYERALSGLLSELSIDQFYLLGHSMGGWVSWRYAAGNPDRVKGLILVSASGMPPGPTDKVDRGLGFRIAQSAVGRMLSQFVTPRSIVRDSVAASVFDQSRLSKALVDRYYELLLMPGNRKALGARMVADREPELTESVANIGVHTLLLWGEHDSFVPASAAAEFAQRMPSTRTVILENTGHMPVEESPARVAELLMEYLLEQESGDSVLEST